MIFLPKENIIYKTKLEPIEIIYRLNNVIEPYKSFRLKGILSEKEFKEYEGEIINNTYNVKRIISYRNSFLPRIEGEIIKDLSGTKINVKMKLHSLVLFFMIIWMSLTLIFFLFLLKEMIKAEKFSFEIFPALLMLIFGYGMTLGGFKYESIKSKKYFEKLFEAEIIKE
ncbi:MAG: hypothetical protein KYX68_04805 [Flavobacterium sp.]|nr:hypothetical protein [Flavobacterium sp.]